MYINPQYRLFDILEQSAIQYPNYIALSGKRKGKWISYTYKEFKHYADLISSAWLKMGIKKGERIATVMTNMPEWNFLEMGTLQTGAVFISLYITFDRAELKSLLNRAEVKFCVVSNPLIYKLVIGLIEEVPTLQNVILLDYNNADHAYNDLLELGKRNYNEELLEAVKADVQPTDLSSIIFTSGTSGKPKGIIWTHEKPFLNVVSMGKNYLTVPGDRALSYLPATAGIERSHYYIYMYHGLNIQYAESASAIEKNLAELQPNIFVTTPLLLEKIYAKIIEEGQQLTGDEKELFDWTLKMTESYTPNDPTFDNQIKARNADELIFKKWRTLMGGHIKQIVCGGAVLPENVEKFFWAAGIKVSQLYGSTECLVISNYNLKEGIFKMGTVGEPVQGENIELQIGEYDEILVRSPLVTPGYYGEPELTAETIDREGWFHTGDAGELVDGRYLKISGRIKEVFKIASGKYFSPGNVEKQLVNMGPFTNALVFNYKNRLAAILMVNALQLPEWLANHDMEAENGWANEAFKKYIHQKVAQEYNRKVFEAEKIHRLFFKIGEWTLESGDVTATGKVKRRAIQTRFLENIADYEAVVL